MPCYNPLLAWRSNYVNPETKKRGITFQRASALTDLELKIPCGRCMGCRIKYATQWAIRCVHESLMHKQSCFITLTYDDDHLPVDGSLNPKHFTDFMKRFRKEISPIKIRFFMCGEYGDLLSRPHFHALIFGYDFNDKIEHQYRAQSILYTSKQLERLWPFGFNTIGAVTYSSAAYTARYATKKITGDMALSHYGGKTPEYVRMSRMPGIGQSYFEKHRTELFRNDNIVINGKKHPLPKYYNLQFTKLELEDLQRRRNKFFRSQESENTTDRLRTRETVLKSKLKTYKRNL
ncbi:MAG: replication initiator protein [Microviridae sp.]|nr:MAG: replication initiator protein [Microviridae sp.]